MNSDSLIASIAEQDFVKIKAANNVHIKEARLGE